MAPECDLSDDRQWGRDKGGTDRDLDNEGSCDQEHEIRIATKTRMASWMNKVTSNTKYYRFLALFVLPPVGDIGNVTFSSSKAGHSSPRMAKSGSKQSIRLIWNILVRCCLSVPIVVVVLLHPNIAI